MKFSRYFYFLVLLYSCSSPSKPVLFEQMKNSGIDFTNTVVDGQIENSFYYRNYYNGGGVAIGDINNDGFCDALLTSNMGENKLYLNKGDFKFHDITPTSGMKQDSMWSTGVVMTDVNADGWLDIYICNAGNMKSGNRRNKLYINNRNLTFTDSAAQYGLDISAYSTHASFFDYDLDGDLDCFLINNSPMPINNLGYTNRRDLPDAEWPVADFLKGGGDHLYRNDNGRFTEVSQQAGIHGTLISFGLGVSVGDINFDGYPDVYVANDSYERDYLYINQKNGTFRDEMESWIEQNSFSSMGADLADVNNDGYMDIFTTDMLPDDDYRLKTLGAFDNIDLYNTRLDIGFYRQFMKNCLFINNRNGKFLETANYSGVPATDWSWGALFFDADNDGLNDIYVCNGVNRDVTNLDFMDFFANDVVQKMVISGTKQNVDSVLRHIPVNAVANKVYRNAGNFRFDDVGTQWGLHEPSFSNGAAYGDLDNDGDLDLIVNNENQPAFVYRNNSREQNGNNYISVQLAGTTSNKFAIGSKIRVHAGSQVFYRELIPSRGFQSSMDYKQVIGLGSLKTIDSVVVIWPNGYYSRYFAPAVNQVHHWKQGNETAIYPYTLENDSTRTVFQAASNSFEAHKEDDYIDFYYERNLPALLSREGPHATVADVNADGLDDLYMGGARGQGGQLYLQAPDGAFRAGNNSAFTSFKDFEDVAVLFFDADKDGDPDLFIGSGGNRSRPGDRELEHRLYINDGKGNFAIDVTAFPGNAMNVSVAVNYDYDNDGDEDLFVGGRSVPYNYGVIPASYLYNNDGKGHFRDVTAATCPPLAQAGMITAASWTDLDGDRVKELVLAGEWMHPRVFKLGGAKLTEARNTGLEQLQGWWQSLHTTDLNGDGHQDLVLGNIGDNFYLRPAKESPVKLWIADFDNNTGSEQFLTRSVGGKDVPVFLKREITEQFPALKKANLKHSDYARKSIQDLFGEKLIGTAARLTFNYSSSIIAYSNGQGGFTVKPLPMEVQLSSVNAINSLDINHDGVIDILIGGNRFIFPPQFGRLDASYGNILLGTPQGELKVLHSGQSGIMVEGETRDIRIIGGKKNNRILFMRNNMRPVIYTTRK